MKRLSWTLFLALPFGLLGAADAHPVDEMVQAAYLTLAPGKVQLELDLTPGVQVTAPLVKALDPNGDARVTDAEARRYALGVLAQSSLTLDGKVAAWTLSKVTVPRLETFKLGGTLQIFATAQRADRPGAATLSYQNGYGPVKSQWMANIFLLPSSGWQYGVSNQQHSNDGRGLIVTYKVARS